jgi:hypothetical protein
MMKKILSCITSGRMSGSILAIVAVVSWITPAAAYDWKIDSISVKPNLFPAEGTVVAIDCSWSRSGNASDETNGSVRILHSYKGAVNDSIKSMQLSPSSPGGNISASWVAQDMGDHKISCEIGFAGKDPLYNSKEPDYANNKKAVVVSVSKKIQDTKWPTAPVIVTPGQNQKVLPPVKVLVKPFSPSDKNCTDNGVLWLSKMSVGPKMLSKPLPSMMCKPEGAVWELNLVPGVYQIKAQLINSKYNFQSDWSGLVTFEVIGTK